MSKDLKAPIEWHENNIILGKDKPCNSKEITTTPFVGGPPITVITGSVARYTRVKAAPKDKPEGLNDDYSFLDWQVDNGYVEVVWSEEKEGKLGELLDFYVLTY